MRLLSRFLSRVAFHAAWRLGRNSVTVNGCWGRFRGHADDIAMLGHYGYHGTWSAGTVELLVQTAREIVDRGEPPPLLLDVGASIGLVSIGVLRQAPGQALAIECYPDSIPLLKRNIIKNRMDDRIEIKNMAVGAPESNNRSVRMARTPGNGGDCWVIDETDENSGTPLVSLDEIAANYPDIPLLLKVDVQGYEPQVLVGGSETFQQARLTVIEFWPYGIQRMGLDPETFIKQLLENNNHRIALMHDEHRVQPVNWISRETAVSELKKIIADGRMERQVEIILGGMN